MSHLCDEEEIRRLSRRIAAEFEATYGTLDEKVRRVPDAAAQAIADECEVHLEVARVAYRVMLDGIIPEAKLSCGILMREFHRRADCGSPVPEINSYMRNVALIEGKWVEYLYGQLGKVLLADLRNLNNLTRTIADEIEPANEQVIAVLAQRQKVAEAYFKSLIQRWLNDHEAASIAEAIQTITGGILGTKVESIDDAINGARASVLIKFRRYEQFLSRKGENENEESRILDRVLTDLRQVIEEVQGPLHMVSEDTASEILIEVMPPAPESIGEKPKYGFVHSAFPAHGRAGPPMQSPLDFLERDVWLAVMQPPADRAQFLEEKIRIVMDRLIDQGKALDELGSIIIFDLDSRFKWTRSMKNQVRKELRELRDTAGEDYREQIENYVLENILSKIPQLRSKPPSTQE